jgi:Flp pilus assembly protein TadG
MIIGLRSLLKEFQASRRAAFAMMTAICLVPLVLLIALAIDYAFFVQTSQQVSRAAEAAATQAVRTAAAGYALDISNGDTVSQAASDAITDGQNAGTQWFEAQSGNLVRGAAGNPSVKVAESTGANNGAGFTATVNYTFTYPPFFNPLFGRSSNWVYSNTSVAQSGYQYVEVLLLLDTSASMEIGANPSDITTLEYNSVCYPSISGFNTNGLGSMFAGTSPVTAQYPIADPTYGPQMTADGDTINFLQATGYWDPGGANAANNINGDCETNYGVAANGHPATSPLQPCAFACHTTSNIANGNFTDPYGQARSLGVTLRLDVVLTAAEQVAQDLYNTEQAANQFSLGVYQFNSTASAMVNGGSGTEATTNLTSAKTTLESYDYAYAGNNALLPAVLTTNPAPHNTNFPLAINSLVNGSGTVPQIQPVTNTQADPAGSTSTNPIKNIFIVTDGFEDAASANGLTLDFGEMTSSTAENAYTSTGTVYNGNATGYCAKLKALGLNVYVLYVTYDSVPILPYYQSGWIPGQANYADATDYPSAFSYGSYAVPRALAQPTSVAETIGTNPDPSQPATAGEVSPNEEALQACASNGDFRIASSAADITAAMSAMLKSAISSSIILTK